MPMKEYDILKPQCSVTLEFLTGYKEFMINSHEEFIIKTKNKLTLGIQFILVWWVAVFTVLSQILISVITLHQN